MNSKLIWVLMFIFAGLVANNVYTFTLLADAHARTAAANAEIIKLAKCHGEQAMCSWSTK